MDELTSHFTVLLLIIYCALQAISVTEKSPNRQAHIYSTLSPPTLPCTFPPTLFLPTTLIQTQMYAPAEQIDIM